MAKKEELKVESKEVEQTKEPIIYVGPTIQNKIVQYALFSNGLPKFVEDLKQETKGFEHLLVGVSKLNEAKEMLKDKTSYLSNIYAEVAKKWGAN